MNAIDRKPSLLDFETPVPAHRRVPQLRTERLLLRRWKATDREPFAQMNQDPRVMEFMPERLSRAQSDDLAERADGGFDRDGMGLYAVERCDSGAFIGFVGLVYRPHASFPVPPAPCVEIGWRLAADHWGQGFATEAALAVLRAGFDIIELPEIVSFTTPKNLRSRKVMERIGLRYRPGCDFMHPALSPDCPVAPAVLYSLTREDYFQIGAMDVVSSV